MRCSIVKPVRRGTTGRSSQRVTVVATRERSLVTPLLRLENVCFRAYYGPHRFHAANFRYYLRNTRTICLVARNQDDIVGYALGIGGRGSRRHIARLHSIAVDPAWRRRGIGVVLLESFVNAARVLKCRVVLAEVASRNRAAMSLFVREGFEPLRRLPDFYGVGIEGVRVRAWTKGRSGRSRMRHV